MDLENKKVCITGGSGFLGTNIVDCFKSKNVEVFVPKHKDYDLTKLEDAKKMIDDSGARIVIHAAADVGGLGYITKNTASIFRNNLNMTINILEASAYVEKLVLLGSACAYPGDSLYLSGGKLKEDVFLSGAMHDSVEGYGFSKRAMYIGAKAYQKQHGLKSIFLLLGSMYGYHDKYNPNESHVVAALIKKFVDAKHNRDKQVVCWGTGKPIREFLFAGDCAEAIYIATEKYDKLDPLNVGTGIGTTIKELAEIIKDAVKYDGEIVWDTSKPDGTMEKVLDTGKMERELKWKPKTSFKDGIKRTVDWYEKEWLNYQYL